MKNLLLIVVIWLFGPADHVYRGVSGFDAFNILLCLVFLYAFEQLVAVDLAYDSFCGGFGVAPQLGEDEDTLVLVEEFESRWNVQGYLAASGFTFPVL